jgi:hypothetical protein
MRRFVLVLLVALAAAPAALGAPPLLGIKGSLSRFHDQTGQESRVGHAIIGWNQGSGWGAPFSTLVGQLGEIPMIGLATGGKPGQRSRSRRSRSRSAGATRT